MAFLFSLVFVCWFFTWFFLFRKKSRRTLQNLQDAEQAMNRAGTRDEKRAAARRVLAIIDDEDLAGVIVDDARAAAERVLRFG